MDININVRGSGGASTASEIKQSTTEVRNLIQALQELRQASQGGFSIATSVSGGVAVGVPTSMAQGAAQAQARAAAPTITSMASQANQQAAQSANNATAAMNSYATSIDRARHRVTELRRELEGLDRIRSASTNRDRYREALAIGGPNNAPTIMARAIDPEHYAGVESRLAEAEERVRNLNNRRVRPGESIDAAHSAALRENESRTLRSEQQRLAAMRAEIAQERSIAMQGRRDNMDRLWGGMALTGAGTATMGALGGAVNLFGQSQLTRIGVQAQEGANTDAVFSQARSDARNTFGMGYRDILDYQRMMKDAGESTEEARRATLALSDAIAGTGNSADVLQRVAVNMAQIRQQTTLSRRDLRELDIARLGGTRRLAEGLGITQGELGERMQRGEVSGEQAFRTLIGQFEKDFGGRGRQITDQTLLGQWEKTREEMEETAEIAGEALAPALGTINKGLRGLLELARENPALIRGGAIGAGVFGIGATAIGTTALARYGLGAVGQMMPSLQNLPGVGGLFGGTANQQAATTQLTAAEIQLQAARLQLAGGVGGAGGALSGATSNVQWQNGQPIIPGASPGTRWMFNQQQIRAWQQSSNWFANQAGASPIIGGIQSAGAARGTVGMGMGAAMGAFGGYQQYGSMRDMGADEATAAASAAFVGAGEAAVAMFVPGGAVAVAFVEGARGLFNMAAAASDRQAEGGNGLSPENEGSYPRADHAGRAAMYLQEANEAQRRVDNWTPWESLSKEELQTEADTKRGMWRLESRLARDEPVKRAAELKEKDWQEFLAADPTSEMKSRLEPGEVVSGGSKRGWKQVPQMRGIKNTSDGGRDVHFTLHLPPSDWERDLEEASI